MSATALTPQGPVAVWRLTPGGGVQAVAAPPGTTDTGLVPAPDGPLVAGAAPSQRAALATWLAAAGAGPPPAEPFLLRARRTDGLPWVGRLHAVDGRGTVVAQRAGGPVVGPGEPVPATPPRDGPDHVLNHDVRAGARSARSFLAIHRRRLGAADTGATEALDTAARALATLEATLDALVQFQRLDTDPLALAPVALADLVVDAGHLAADRLAGLARGPGQGDLAEGLVVHGPGHERGDRPLIGRGDLLAGVLAELCVNARKFAGGPTVVTVDATWDGPWATVRVANTGRPIAAGLAEEAFALGRLLQPRGERPGAGLGLPLVRRALTRHAGAVRFVPAATGTVVEVELPGAAGAGR